MTGNRSNSNGTSTTTANGSSNLEMGHSNQDLLVSKSINKRKWIIVGVIVAVAVALAVTAIVLLATKDSASSSGVPASAALTLDDFLSGKFAPKSFNGTWTSGNQLIFKNFDGDLVHLNVTQNTSTVLLASTDPLSLSAFDFQLSTDGLYLLVAYNYQKLYRHSFLAQYTIIDLTNGDKYNMNPVTRPYQLVVWAPQGNALAYVYQNNIYYKSSVETEEVPITSTTDFIYNGVPDWVNEEEVFSSNKALWFSPDGKKLAYARFEDTTVPVMVIPLYGEPGTITSQYPRVSFVKYPKAGATNPNVSLHLVDLNDLSTITSQELNVPNVITTQPLLTAVQWASDTVLTAIWMNRVQNQAALTTYYATTTPATQVVVRNIVSNDGWLELFTPPVVSQDGTKLLLILSQDQGGEAGAYRHIVMFDRVENAEEQALTRGKFVVTEILGWDRQENLIYYTANTESNSSVQHLYTVSPDTKDTKCLTCPLKSKYNSSTDCLYNTADFSTDMSYYALTCAGPDVPQVSIYSKNGTELLVWSENEELVGYVREKTLPTFKRMSFEVADGFTANVLLRLPPNMDTSGDTKYPMLVNVYGGPDTYQVVDKFFLDWGSYLASNKSIIYAVIDGRGSGLRGDKLMFAGYRKLGTVEVEDQINVTRLIQKELPYVDSTRTAIWGWSYGGYVSGMALATDTEGVFKCGISVAPVTDWALYDSIYTERFMGLPTEADNLKAYEDSQLLKKYEGLRDKEYFLIHGTHDDNVHYQQSMMWSKVLELNDILFRQQSYPDEDHNLSLVRPHLYHSLENFLDECFIEKTE